MKLEDFLQPVDDDPELVHFDVPMEFEAKALIDGADDPDLLEEGDLIIEGYGAVWEGKDRSGENFAEGAFEEGVKAFLDGNAPLVFHHKKEKLLGKVLRMEETPEGLKIRARVDGAIKDHPELGTLYKQIKKGTLKGLSVGGFFRRKLTGDGPRVVGLDMTEFSVTPVPVHAMPAFSVVAQKALEDFEPPATRDAHAGDDGTAEIDFTGLGNALAGLHSALEEGKALREEGKAVKGDPQDLHFLQLIVDLEEFSNNLVNSTETEEGGPVDEQVDALVTEVKDALDGYARTAHKLLAKLGPAPNVNYG